MSAHPNLAEIATLQSDLAAAIEREITRSALELGQAETPEQRRDAWDRLQWLHKQRPKATVVEMEQRRGLG